MQRRSNLLTRTAYRKRHQYSGLSKGCEILRAANSPKQMEGAVRCGAVRCGAQYWAGRGWAGEGTSLGRCSSIQVRSALHAVRKSRARGGTNGPGPRGPGDRRPSRRREGSTAAVAGGPRQGSAAVWQGALRRIARIIHSACRYARDMRLHMARAALPFVDSSLAIL